MIATPELIGIVEKINGKVQGLVNDGCDEVTIIAEMCDDMPGFKRLIDSLQPSGLDALCRQYAGFYYYAKVLERMAGAIASGQITVPK